MGVITFTDENTSVISPSRIFKASILDSHNLIPKLLPQGIMSIDLIQGDGGAGSIKQVNFPQGYLKQWIDELDEKTYTYKYSVIEGGPLTDKIEKLSYEIQLEASEDGGTISKVTTKCYIKGDGDFEINEEKLKDGKEKIMAIQKVIEAYLLQNPDAYV